MFTVIALGALFGLIVIVAVLAQAGGREFDTPSRNYNDPRV